MEHLKIVIPAISQKLDNYTRVVSAAGMVPVRVSEPPERKNALWAESYDGLLLPGGWDVDPARYGQKDDGSFVAKEDIDALQLAVLDAFVRRKKPVFGICRGMQLINVYFGGTLIQHLPTAFRHCDMEGHQNRIHASRAEADSWIRGVYGREFVHNSSHHQAADRLGEGLVLDAVCPEDGVAEALHHVRYPVYAVQWHPEQLYPLGEDEGTVDGLPVLLFFREVILAQKK